jgi:hypothetical protein
MADTKRVNACFKCKTTEAAVFGCKPDMEDFCCDICDIILDVGIEMGWSSIFMVTPELQDDRRKLLESWNIIKTPWTRARVEEVLQR